MDNRDIIRAWRDDDYRMSLSAGELTALPEHPSGSVELPDAVLRHAVGGRTEFAGTLGCCGGFTRTETEACQGTCGDTVWCCTVTTRRAADMIGAMC
ncbi:mersacidin/lichenicidin family type 2 lantibiotic [Plantactinospora sp. CA-290183]|uniref:mersacidin/lichenicidin family type 2 lantibiotic n=1 Tax=Plantactinospora sp. CA-290183 TaxID=3240006 RepID=UPI003D8B5B3C